MKRTFIVLGEVTAILLCLVIILAVSVALGSGIGLGLNTLGAPDWLSVSTTVFVTCAVAIAAAIRAWEIYDDL